MFLLYVNTTLGVGVETEQNETLRFCHIHQSCPVGQLRELVSSLLYV